ncbi:MAG: hypothetical protein K1X55_14445 [Chitinophagales bacterium]|nr:hypothetical protein [Chitinophagales bacterium]
MLGQLLPGLIILFICLFIGRAIMMKAFYSLNDQQKLLLMNATKGLAKTYLIPTIIALVLFFLAGKFFPQYLFATSILYFIALGGLVLYSNYVSYQRLKSQHFPDSFYKSFVKSKIYNITGIALFIIYFIFQYMLA